MYDNILPIHLDIETSAGSSPKYREQLKKEGGMFVSEIKNASSEKLYGLLAERNVVVEKKDIREASSKYFSALELFNALISDTEVKHNPWDESICHLSLIFLWEKENGGNHPCMEFFDYHIYRGYGHSDKEDFTGALNKWYEAYKLIFYFIHSMKISSIDLLKEQFEGNYELKIWLEDYLTLLTNISEPFYLQQQRVVCEQFLDIFAKEKGEIIFLIKINYAASFFFNGQENKGNKLYEEWLIEDPTWTKGWMAWADYYWTSRDEKNNLRKAIEILEKALKRIPILEKKDIIVRLETLYEQENMTEEALKMAIELKQIFNKEQEQEQTEKISEEQFLASLMKEKKS